MTGASSGRHASLLDMLLGGAALIVETHHTIRFHGQVGDDEAHAG
jgi:hypothetical protein